MLFTILHSAPLNSFSKFRHDRSASPFLNIFLPSCCPSLTETLQLARINIKVICHCPTGLSSASDMANHQFLLFNKLTDLFSMGIALCWLELRQFQMYSSLMSLSSLLMSLDEGTSPSAQPCMSWKQWLVDFNVRLSFCVCEVARERRRNFYTLCFLLSIQKAFYE